MQCALVYGTCTHENKTVHDILLHIDTHLYFDTHVDYEKTEQNIRALIASED